MASVAIRMRTDNVKGPQDSLRAIDRAGRTIEAEWPLEQVPRIGDQARGGYTLTELYGKMASQHSCNGFDSLAGTTWGGPQRSSRRAK
jgi:hypothetical protein